MENVTLGFPARAGRFCGDSGAGNQGAVDTNRQRRHPEGQGIPSGLEPGYVISQEGRGQGCYWYGPARRRRGSANVDRNKEHSVGGGHVLGTSSSEKSLVPTLGCLAGKAVGEDPLGRAPEEGETYWDSPALTLAPF